MKIKFLVFLCVLFAKSFAVDNYKKGDVLYALLKEGVTLYEKPDLKSKIKKELAYKEQVMVIEDKLKKVPFVIEEIQAIPSQDPNIDAFPGFTINGFWVKVITQEGKISGYVFDGYLSILKSGFELTREYFNKEFILTKSVVVPPKKNDDYLFANTYYYQNGAYILENGSDYDSHARYFIPNVSLQEAYLLIKSPGLFELEVKDGKNITKINGDKYNLIFSTKMEKRSLETKVGKIIGIEIAFETWSKH